LETVAASRGRVVQVATHELGTPLTQVALSLGVAGKLIDLLKETGDIETHSYELSSRLRAAVDGVTGVNERFIRPLREYYELELLLDRLALRLLEPEALEMMVKKWRQLAVDRYFEIFEQLPLSLRVDPDLFDRALTELIKNAVNYSPAGACITVTAGRQQDWLLITVADDGIGIPPRDLPHVDRWLYRGDNVANLNTMPAGLGIGLHTVRRIVEAHGGHLKIESELERGTQVSLSLPAFTG
jgi:signal transduction histidine kinase